MVEQQLEQLRSLSKKMEKELEPKRYQHTLSVASTASCMAMRFGVDPYKAYLAGLLHDNAKCIKGDKKIKLCRQYKLSVSEVEKKNPELLHAKLGSYLAKEKYGIEDEDVLSAIMYHTTGKPDMTELEMIIYIADYIEIFRKNLPQMELVRKLAFEDLDQCMLAILESTISYLQAKNSEIDDITNTTYAFYKNKVENKL